MSDEPASYFVNGVELLGFRREYSGLYAPGEVNKPKKKRNNRKYDARGVSEKLVERDGNLCHYCSIQMMRPGDKDYQKKKLMTIEHIVPRSLGGGNARENLVLACLKCNNGFGSEPKKCECVFCKNARRVKGLD